MDKLGIMYFTNIDQRPTRKCLHYSCHIPPTNTSRIFRTIFIMPYHYPNILTFQLQTFYWQIDKSVAKIDKVRYICPQQGWIGQMCVVWNMRIWHKPRLWVLFKGHHNYSRDPKATSTNILCKNHSVHGKLASDQPSCARQSCMENCSSVGCGKHLYRPK
jgi:hypothetical protein